MTATPDRTATPATPPADVAVPPAGPFEGDGPADQTPATAAARGAAVAGTDRGPSASSLSETVPSLHAEGPRPSLTFTVYGQPAPQGSKRTLPHKATGRVVTMESSKKVKPWRQDVKAAALDAMGGRPMRLDGPLAIWIDFTVTDQPAGRPPWWPTGERFSSKFRTRPAVPPDLSKLIRSTEDALTDAGAIRDDARIVLITASKHYVSDDPARVSVLPAPGAVIHVRQLGLTEGMRP